MVWCKPQDPYTQFGDYGRLHLFRKRKYVEITKHKIAMVRSEGFSVNEKSTDTSWDRTSDLLPPVLSALKCSVEHKKNTSTKSI